MTHRYKYNAYLHRVLYVSYAYTYAYVYAYSCEAPPVSHTAHGIYWTFANLPCINLPSLGEVRYVSM